MPCAGGAAGSRATMVDQQSNTENDPDEWVTGDEPMTGAQASYLRTLSQEAGEELDENLRNGQASQRIEELQQRTGRGQGTWKTEWYGRATSPAPKGDADADRHDRPRPHGRQHGPPPDARRATSASSSTVATTRVRSARAGKAPTGAIALQDSGQARSPARDLHDDPGRLRRRDPGRAARCSTRTTPWSTAATPTTATTSRAASALAREGPALRRHAGRAAASSAWSAATAS